MSLFLLFNVFFFLFQVIFQHSIKSNWTYIFWHQKNPLISKLKHPWYFVQFNNTNCFSWIQSMKEINIHFLSQKNPPTMTASRPCINPQLPHTIRWINSKSFLLPDFQIQTRQYQACYLIFLWPHFLSVLFLSPKI